MVHKPRNIPPGAQDKRRVKIYQLAQEVKRQHGLQNKINARQAKINTDNVIQTEEIMTRLAKLERIVLPAQHPLQKQNVFRRFWNWTLGK